VKGDVKSKSVLLWWPESFISSGHNVAIYNIDEKTQTYISGVDGSEVSRNDSESQENT